MRIPRHHPSADLLIDYSAGQVDLPRRFLIDCHLDLCAACRSELDALQAPGQHWLEGVREAAPPPTIWERLARSLDDSPGTTDGGLPLPREWRTGSLPWQGSPRWRSPLTRGVEVAILAREDEYFLVAARAGADRRFPTHQHLGSEETLVLTGGYRDDELLVEAGDFVRYEAGSSHRPATEADEGCVLLARVETGIRFTGWRGGLEWLSTKLGRNLWTPASAPTPS